MKLNEIKKEKDPNAMDVNYVPQTKEEVTEWIYTHIGMVKHWVTPELEVDFTDLSKTQGILQMSSKKIKGKIPIKLRKVKGILNVSFNYLTTFENFPEEAEFIWASNNRFKSLVGVDRIKRITGIVQKPKWGSSFGPTPSYVSQFDLTRNEKIAEGGIGLLNIEGLTSFDISEFVAGVGRVFPPPFEIIKKYLGRPEDIYDCQAELIDAGFEAYSKL